MDKLKSFNHFSQRFHEYFSQSDSSDQEFNQMAMNLFSFQRENNPIYDKYCKQILKEKIDKWQQIPPLSTTAFKEKEISLTCFPPEKAEKIFFTSGTTKSQQGKHYFLNIDTYEHSILESWKKLNIPSFQQAIFLSPRAEKENHSSLIHMFETLSKKMNLESTKCSWIYPVNSKNLSLLEKLTSEKKTILLLGTAISFLHLFEKIGEKRFKLPPQSWALQTGGYKGKYKSLSQESLYKKFHHYLGIPAKNIINEYSMTELSSQFYSIGINQAHQAPHWVKIQAIKPETNQIISQQEEGHLIIYDLANIGSVLAIRTQDRVIYHNEHSFTLLGRDINASPRGCSLSSYEL